MMVSDNNDINFDINRSNNYKLVSSQGDSAIIIISLTPPPDLALSFFTIPDRGPAGQPVKARFAISNNGPGNIKAGSVWTDKNLFIN
ncbi:MAG: hypothetical protein IPL42_09625 [Saprospiraceae bacterium]|nr:hypothetical protein [Saprospiraceae bacterium]